MNTFLRIGIAFVLGAILVSCKGPVELALRANEDMNNDAAVRVVYVQLTNNARFNQLTPVEFWANDNAALLGDLAAAKEEIRLSPGDTETIQVELAETTNFLGVAAGYSNPQSDGWRLSFPVGEIRGATITVRLARDRLFVEEGR